MAYPIDGGSSEYGSYSGVFIPTIWSGKLIEKFYDATVLAAIANSDYEGEIKNQGDIVKIRTKPTISINDYSAGQSLTVERPTSSVVELQIDKGKYFNTILDDVMETQADLNLLSMWADDASEQMKIAIDTDVLGNIGADVSTENLGLTAGRISGDVNLGTAGAPVQLVDKGAVAPNVEVIDLITRLGQVLDEQNIPETGRWLIIPSWMCAMIKRSELRDASLTGDSVTMLRNGRLGMIDRFTVYMSNLLPNAAGVTTVFAGHSHGLTFASQLTKVETLRGESSFGTYLRGLQVYGYKVTDGTAITSAEVQKATA
tara:strand:- start:5997 stop:6941 length:945 start_codon:yes stop_codon:yes gene_type:complete